MPDQNLMKSQAPAFCLAVVGTIMKLPLPRPAPGMPPAGAGMRAVAYLSFGAYLAICSTRHGPSTVAAYAPPMKGQPPENEDVFKPDWKRFTASYPSRLRRATRASKQA